ncbi:hypothetical protein [Roseomonas sp. AR75]|uniref:hypothetical protein n=1 Tax=Roseomonas sp. AR75 TaxID=2562311 RepID=UPI0010C121DB|nr:hypothetical protein [Roseomonas sp. AR75]
MTAASRIAGLTPTQFWTCVASGIVFWFLAALFCRFAAPAGWFGGLGSLLLFVVALPGLWAAVVVTRRIAGLSASQLFPGVSAATMAATLCDGVAITWVPSLYGGVTPGLAPAAAWILWGAGAGMLIALLMGRREGG